MYVIVRVAMDPFCFIYIPVAGILLGTLYIIGGLGSRPSAEANQSNFGTLILGCKIIGKFLYLLFLRMLMICLIPIEKLWVYLGHDNYTFAQAVCWRFLILRARYFCTETDKQLTRKWLGPILGNIKVIDFSTSWKDGVILCQVMYRIFPVNDLKPSALKSEGAYRRFSFALQYARERLFVQTSVTPKDLMGLTNATENIMVELLVRINVACAKLGIDTTSLKSPSLDSLSDVEESKNDIVLVEGPGLKSGCVGEKATFTIEFYTKYLDVVVDIRGCGGEFCTRRITNRSPRRKLESRTSSDNTGSDNEDSGDFGAPKTNSVILFEYEILNNIVNVGYYPKTVGIYEVKVFFMGRTVPGSPFRPVITESSSEITKSPSVSPLIRSRSSSEERFRCYTWSFNESPVKPFKRRIVKQVVNIGDEQIEVTPQEGISITEAMRNKINSKRSISFEEDKFPVCSREMIRSESFSFPLKPDKSLHLDLQKGRSQKLEDIVQSPVTEIKSGVEETASQNSPNSATPFVFPKLTSEYSNLIDVVKAATKKREERKDKQENDVNNELCSQSGTPNMNSPEVIEIEFPKNTDKREIDVQTSVSLMPQKPILETDQTLCVDSCNNTLFVDEIFPINRDNLNAICHERKSSLQPMSSIDKIKLKRQYSLTFDSFTADHLHESCHDNESVPRETLVNEADDKLCKVHCDSNLPGVISNSLTKNFLEINLASEKEDRFEEEDLIQMETYPLLGVTESVVESELQGPIKVLDREVQICQEKKQILSPELGKQENEECKKSSESHSNEDIDELFDKIYIETQNLIEQNEAALSDSSDTSFSRLPSGWVMVETSEESEERIIKELSMAANADANEIIKPERNTTTKKANKTKSVIVTSEMVNEQSNHSSDEYVVEKRYNLPPGVALNPEGSTTLLTDEDITKEDVAVRECSNATFSIERCPTSLRQVASEKRGLFGVTPLNSFEEEVSPPSHGQFLAVGGYSDSALLNRTGLDGKWSDEGDPDNGIGLENVPSLSMSQLDIGSQILTSASTCHYSFPEEQASDVQNAKLCVNEFVQDLTQQLDTLSCINEENADDEPALNTNSQNDPSLDSKREFDGEFMNIKRIETIPATVFTANDSEVDSALESRMEDINGDTYLIVESYEIPRTQLNGGGTYESSDEDLSSIYGTKIGERDVTSSEMYEEVNDKLSNYQSSFKPLGTTNTKPPFPPTTGKAGFLGVKPYLESSRALPTSISQHLSTCVHNITPTPFKPFIVKEELKKSPASTQDYTSDVVPLSDKFLLSNSPVKNLKQFENILDLNTTHFEESYSNFAPEDVFSCDSSSSMDKFTTIPIQLSESSYFKEPTTEHQKMNQNQKPPCSQTVGNIDNANNNKDLEGSEEKQSCETKDLIESRIVKTRKQYWDKVLSDHPRVESDHNFETEKPEDHYPNVAKARRVFEDLTGDNLKLSQSSGKLPVKEAVSLTDSISPEINFSLDCKKSIPFLNAYTYHAKSESSLDRVSDSNVYESLRPRPASFNSTSSSPLCCSPRQSSSFRKKLATWEARTSPIPSRPSSRSISYEQHMSEMNKLTSSVTQWENKSRVGPPSPVISSFLTKSSVPTPLTRIKNGSWSTTSSDSSSFHLTPQSSTDSEGSPSTNDPTFSKSLVNKNVTKESKEDECPLRYPEDYSNDYPYLPKNTLCSRRRFTPGTQMDLVSLNNLNNYL